MSFQSKLAARRSREQDRKKRKSFLVESVRKLLLPELIQRGFQTWVETQRDPENPKYRGSFPFPRLVRFRESATDQVQIQFSSYQRAAFRINACAVPKEGMMTVGGYKTAEEAVALGVHNLMTHARPWLRPAMRKLGLEPLGEWFSVWRWPYQSVTQSDYERLVQRAVDVLPELEAALRGGKLGPCVRRIEMRPLPPEILEHIRKVTQESSDRKA